jgi:hypothetical protein
MPQAPDERKVFLSAEWRDLIMLNYAVDPQLLQRYVPPGTVLDSFDGKTYVSLVGFRFLRTKLFGAVPIPFHSTFDEVNLRFYVRRQVGSENHRRGVVFIAEVVPKRAIALTARLAYGENYIRLPMKHHLSTNATTKSAEYHWRVNGAWCKLHAQAASASAPAREGGLEQFITEHYWGYSAGRNSGTLEYHVSHVPWNVWPTTSAGFEGDPTSLYGPDLANILKRQTDSAFIADGSPVTVFTGKEIQ